MTSAVLLVAALATGAQPPAGSARYAIDRNHSRVGFSIRHFFMQAEGEFRDFEGSVQLHPGALASSSVEVRIEAASIHTGNMDRDRELKAGDFFDVARHPELRFESRSLEVKGLESFVLHGLLSIKGITRPVALECACRFLDPDARGRERLGCTATASVERADFGLDWNLVLDGGNLMLGKQVSIRIDLVAVRDPAPEGRPVSAP